MYIFGLLTLRWIKVLFITWYTEPVFRVRVIPSLCPVWITDCTSSSILLIVDCLSLASTSNHAGTVSCCLTAAAVRSLAIFRRALSWTSTVCRLFDPCAIGGFVAWSASSVVARIWIRLVCFERCHRVLDQTVVVFVSGEGLLRNWMLLLTGEGLHL
jgi:hypothetical protein